ncbi:MAG: ABC transporter permease [Anaerolineae bacterium]
MLRKIWLIARHEYWVNFRRRAFLFTAFGVPIFSVIMLFLVVRITEATVSGTGQLGQIGYVDFAGVLVEAVEKPEEYVAYADEQAAREALLAGEIGAYFVVPEDFMRSGTVDAYAGQGIPEGIEDQFNEFLTANLIAFAPEEMPVERIRVPMRLAVEDLTAGERLEQEGAIAARFLVPFVFALVFVMAVNTTSQFVMSGVVEEKENRVMEILITTCRPIELLWGKLLGLGLLGLTQIVLWGIGGGLIYMLQTDSAFIQGIYLTVDYVVLALVYFVLGYFLLAAVMAGIGAASTAEQEARQISTIFTLVAMLPYILLVSFVEDANGTLPVILSLVPLTAPLSMIMRMSWAVVPAWQIALSIGLLLGSVVGAVWLAARIFHIGLLMYGKRLSLRAIVASIRQGRRTMLTLAQEER